MFLTVREAATQINTSKSSIFRAIRAGKLSATRDDSGGFRVDPAELHRVFGAERILPRDATQDGAGIGAAAVSVGAAVDAVEVRAAVFEAQIAALREMLEAEKRRADEWKEQAAEWKEQAKRLLLAAPVITPAPPTAPAPPQRSWWRWLRQAS